MITVTEFIALLEKEFPKAWFKDGVEWDGQEDTSVWTGEGSYIDVDGFEMDIFNYWSEDYKEVTYVMGVHKKFREFVEKHGFWVECHDAGTYFLYRE
jgi:hypothetical protein